MHPPAARPTRLIAWRPVGLRWHFKTVGAYPELRLKSATLISSANQVNAGAGTRQRVDGCSGTRKSLVTGGEYVDWLNGPHEMTNYRREDFIRIRDEYRASIKALKQREAA